MAHTITHRDSDGHEYVQPATTVTHSGPGTPPVLLPQVALAGQATDATTGAVTAPIVTSGQAFTGTVSFTRPNEHATPYISGDVIGVGTGEGNSTPGSAIHEFADAGPAGGHVRISDSRLRYEVSALPEGMTSFRLHLYDAAPAAIADNAPWTVATGDRAKYLGYIDCGTIADIGDFLFTQASGLAKTVKLAAGSTSLFGILATNGGFAAADATAISISIETVTA